MDWSVDALFARILQNRRLVRAPIWFYRRGAGRLFGDRSLMLEHVGRTTGQPRFVILEVVERPFPNTVIIASGFGERAQWYRNLRARPECHVSTGSLRRVPARARFLTEDEGRAALDRYRRAHPRSWERLQGAIEKIAGHKVDRLPFVELTLAR